MAAKEDKRLVRLDSFNLENQNKQTDIKLSVVIPVFNAAQYLDECITSIINQSLKEIEIICVDDGSTDNSFEILNDYASRDHRIHVFKQENLHAGVARNTGLAAAKGEYIHFLDADDYVFNYSYEAVYSKAAKHQLDYLAVAAVPYDMQREQFVFSDYYMLERIYPKDFNRLVSANPKSPIHQVSVAPWSGIYRREFLLEHGLHFNDLFCVNDKSFYYSVITNAEKMMITRDFVVAHRINMSESLVGVRAEHFDCHFRSFEIVLERLMQDEVDTEIQTAVIRREFKDTLNWFEKYHDDPDYGEKIADDLREFVENNDSPYANMISKLYKDKLNQMAKAPTGDSEKQDDILTLPLPVIEQPLVSVVVPVFNAEDYVNEALHSLMSQTVSDIEIICVNDGSTDASLAVLLEYQAIDHRIQIYTVENAGAGAARNFGFEKAKGKYVYFFDADDLCNPELLEVTTLKAEETDADIVAFDFQRFFPDGKRESRKGIHLEHIPKGAQIFNYSDCRERIMNVINPTPWNKLYKASFIRDYGLRFEKISSSNDITFASVSAAKARTIAFVPKELIQYRVGQEGTITSGKEYKLQNILTAVTSAVRQVSELPYYEEIIPAVQYFTLTQYVYGLRSNIKDLSLPVSKMYYESIRDLFLEEQFDYLKREDFIKNSSYDETVYNYFCIIRKNTYEEYCMRWSLKVTVSMTSFPERINCVPAVLKTIDRQTQPADRVVLWLAESQFPGKMDDLPDDLVNRAEDGSLDIEWCDDLKPHKKYFYAFQKYADNIIVTIDDDVYYPSNLLEKLFECYLMFPGAVSSARAHLMAVGRNGEILPYNCWIRNTDCGLYEPSMQLCATGVGGVLYPPYLLTEKMLDKDSIYETCLNADDLWLKAMEMVSDVPVVAALPFKELSFVESSQDTGLKYENLYGEGNDIQFSRIIDWVDAHFHQDILKEKLFSQQNGVHLIGDEALWIKFSIERENLNKDKRELKRKLESANDKRKEFFDRSEKYKEQLKKLKSTNIRSEDMKMLITELRQVSEKKGAKEEELRAVKARLQQVEAEYEYLRLGFEGMENGLSMRVGRVITWPARKIRDLVTGTKHY